MTNKKEKKPAGGKMKGVRILKRIFVDNIVVKVLAILLSVALWLTIGYLI